MLEQMSDPALQDGICGQADRILAALRFSGTVDLPVKRAALEQDCAASRWSGHGRPPAPMQRASPRRSGHCRGARTRKADAGAAIVRLPACSQRRAHGGGRIEHDAIPGPMRTDTVDPAFGQVGERRQSSAWVGAAVQKRRIWLVEAASPHLCGPTRSAHSRQCLGSKSFQSPAVARTAMMLSKTASVTSVARSGSGPGRRARTI
jgi:hypothetical protein